MTDDEAIRLEREAVSLLRAFIRENAASLRMIAHWGDGEAGYIATVFCEELGIERLTSSPRMKAKIPRSLAKRVFERDAYRCVTCGDHHDLTCDHVIAESKGGETTFENLQTMCRQCNCRKGTT